ncbi:MAG TPA: TIGR02300 family protein, partial [Aestuariivirga sp.]|nr:TIGR02300 family protein [Aestuariivirga sp.]
MGAPNQPHPSKGRPVVKAELGTKRTCPSCAARFYDLLKNPITCPKCGVSFTAAAILPSKGDYPGAAPAPAPKARVVEEVDEADT